MKTRIEKFTLLASALMFCISSSAHALVELGPKTKTEVKEVALVESATTDVAGKPVVLKRVTQGLRQKKIALFWASVYVEQIFTNQKADFTSVDQLRESLAKGIPTVVAMTFVRDVGIDKIVDGFKETFAKNAIKVEVTPYSKFLEAVKKSGDVKDKQTYFFAFSGDEKKVKISFQTAGKEQFVMEDADTVTLNNFLKMWLGTAADSGLEQLQGQLLKPETKI